MVEITHDPVTPEMQMLVDKGEDVRLSALANVLSGIGHDVLALVRYGLWEVKEHHLGASPVYDWTRYGPKQ